MINTILQAILPIFIIIFAGFFAGKRKIIDFTHSKSLVTFITTFGLPAILFSTTATTPIEKFSDFRILSTVIFGFIFIFFSTYFIFKKFFKKDSKKSTILALTSSFPNSTFMGIPILIKLYGNEVLTNIIIVTVISSIILIPLGIIFLEADSSENKDVFKHIFKVFKNPMIFMPIIGLVLSKLNIHIPEVINSSCILLGTATPAVALFTMGVRISNFKIVITKNIFITIFFKNIFTPFIFFLFLLIFGVKGQSFKELLVISAIPTATVAPMIASQYNILELESNSAAILGTFLSLFTLGFFIYIV